jgi:ATP-dependent protease ClpP protease subunit
MQNKTQKSPQNASAQAEAELLRVQQQQIEDMGMLYRTRGRHAIHCLTVVGQIEGHVEAPQGQKTTKYEHVIPQLVAVQEDPQIEGLLVLLNTVGGDVEAGLALAELIASVSKPSATLVLGGGHSIGIPLAVSARRSFIVPTATMTVHPVRHSGMILGVPQTMSWFEQMQQRITGFVAEHSGITEKRFTQLMMHTGELVMDVGTTLDGPRAVRERLIDELGGLSDAMDWLYAEIERGEASNGR